MARRRHTGEHVRIVLVLSAGVSTGRKGPTAKECVPSVSVRKRNRKKAHVSRAAQLEAKLEDLVTLLRHQASPTDRPPSRGDTADAANTSTPALSGHSTTSPSEHSSPRSAAPMVPVPERPPHFGYTKGPPVREPPAGTIPDHSNMGPLVGPSEALSMPGSIYLPDHREATKRLETFRKYMLIFLPFVHIPASMTSERLKQESPFLWYSIMTVTCEHVDRRLSMSDTAKKFVAQKIVVEHEKNVDLIHGLIVFMGWTHCHLKKDKPILTVLASLAKSLVFDLCLNKPFIEPSFAACLKALKQPYLVPIREKTLQERRAVLACFLLTSQLAYSNKRLDALNWTPYMDECLEILSQQQEWEGDDLLIAQVKVQLLVEEVTRAASQSPDGIPPCYVLSSLRTQLQATAAQLPPHLKHNDTILSHISYAELAIHEPALNKLTATGPHAKHGTFASIQRYEALEACLNAIHDWVDRHFSIPSYVYVGMTFTYWWNMAHCMLMLYKLSVLDEPAWNRRAVRQRLDLLAVCDRLGAGFDDISGPRNELTGPTLEEDSFAKFAKMVRAMKANWAPDLAVVDGHPAAAASAAAAAAAANNQAFLDTSMEGLNVPFYQTDDSDAFIAGLFDMNWDI
ncbi:hypothetical protein B0J18DRAFT_371625 [Chaetomium sp. MPI-SDFR-AT-0129]|nr:hypothetical protein B0J18DRAFT_371625 [Chaetomium sp. MPI-SDFR-AT-0129]